MRKVGIMSMQRIANYGSFLQAYALKQLIEEVGCNVEFVDYHVGAPVITENADSKNKVVRKIEKGLETFQYQAPLAHKLSFIRYKQSFAQKYMPLLGITDEMNYNPTVDCLVIGSDEGFNCIQKNSNVGYSPELFGKNNHAKKLITYAASFGNTTLLEKYKKANEVGALLKKFDAISVRDANSGTIVEQLTGKEPVYNLDPVLTYDYMNCCDKIPQVQTNEKYLILYAYAGRISNDEADWIAAYAKKKNLKVYAIGGIQKCADRFVDCFFITEQRTRSVTVELEDGSIIEQEETYTATVPLSLAAAYENLAARLGRTITDEDKENAAHIYTMIAGNANGSDGTGASGGAIQIDYGYGSGSTELDTSGFTNPAGKNAADLVQYAIHAYEEHWGYVWGTFGHVLTESLFEAKLAQYPDALAGNADFIRQTWVGGRTTDCVGLIKGYGWLNAETEEIVYNTNGMPDITANEMYHAASVSGTIDTIPETPGLAVWHDGHIGVYIGNGEVVEAMGTRYGAVKTKLEGARWTHWLKIPYISYD